MEGIRSQMGLEIQHMSQGLPAHMPKGGQLTQKWTRGLAEVRTAGAALGGLRQVWEE